MTYVKGVATGWKEGHPIKPDDLANPMNLFGDGDITRAAQSMIKDYGRHAAEKAAEEASNKIGTAKATWLQIAIEIRRLQDEAETDC